MATVPLEMVFCGNGAPMDAKVQSRGGYEISFDSDGSCRHVSDPVSRHFGRCALRQGMLYYDWRRA